MSTTYVTTISGVVELSTGGTLYGELLVRVTRDAGDRWQPPTVDREPLSLKVEGEPVQMDEYWDVVLRLLEGGGYESLGEPEPDRMEDFA